MNNTTQSTPKLAHSATTIRGMRADEPDALALLQQLDERLCALYPPIHRHILSVQQLLEPSVSFVVAYVEGHSVGCGAVRRMPAEPAAGLPAYGEIKRMFVLPAQRGQRIASHVIDYLENVLRSESITCAVLETGTFQPEAIRAYERAGYTQRKAFGEYIDDGVSVLMHKIL